jgi:phenylalanyl-tRNA synthetase beta chain
MAVPDDQVVARLDPLGFSVSSAAPRTSHLAPRTEWQVAVPSHRVDVLREVDLIEEVARHDGYASLPATIPEMDAVQPPPDPRTLLDQRLRQLLSGCGLSEAMTFAFIEAIAAEPFGEPDSIVKVANPLSEKFAVLRPSLLPGLIDSASHNRRHGRTDVRLFEVGTRFSTAGELRAVAGIWCGAGTPAHWSGVARSADFYDVKGVVEMLGAAFGLQLECVPAEVPYMVSGRTAKVGTIGLIGQLQSSILEKRGLPANEIAWAFELDTDTLATAQAADDLRATSLPRFPSIVRDLSVLVDSALPAAAVRGTIRSSAPSTLVDVIEFDRYRGKGVPEGRVSLSLRLTFRSPDRTLTDTEVDQAMDTVVAALGTAHGATRR